MSSIEELKAHIDIVDVASRYCETKRINDNQYQAKVNPIREEKTSSLFFYRDSGKYKDFGSGEGGDVLDFIQAMERCTLPQAKEILQSSGYTTSTPLHVRPAPEVVVMDSDALEREFNSFEKTSFKLAPHKQELLAIAPWWLYKEADKADLAYFQSITRYDAYHKTLVMGWYKNDAMVGFKWRRKGDGKWTNRMGTHINSVPFGRIYHDNAKVYVIEGGHDVLTAILLGLDFIAIPSTSFKEIEAFKSLVRDGDELRYLCEDKAGFNAMERLEKEVKGELFSLSTDSTQKMDLSDFVFTCNSIEGVINGL